MQYYRNVGATLLLPLLLSLGCSRAVENQTSKIIIQAPGTQNKVGTMGMTLPIGRKACFGVSITATDISGASSACSPQTGLVAGYVASGDGLSIDVPYGSGRSLDLYLYLMDTSTGNCPQMGKIFSADELLHVYKVGHVPSFEISSPTTSLSITATFPGVNSTIAQENSYPSSCTAGANTPMAPGFFVSSGSKQLTGGSYKVFARLGRPSEGKSLSGGSYKVKVK